MSDHLPETKLPSGAPADDAPMRVDGTAVIRQIFLAHWLDMVATFVLTVGSLVAAWSGTQASKWSSVQAEAFTKASVQLIRASQVDGRAGQLALYDTVMFDNWIQAARAGEMAEAAEFERQFRSQFVPIFQAWLATDPLNNRDAPSSPLVMPDYIALIERDSAQLEADAAAQLQHGERANKVSDVYVLVGFLSAVALFFAGTAPRFRWLPMRTGMTLLGLLILLWCIVQLLQTPII